MRAEFEKIVKRNSKAKLVCLDIAPTASKQSGEGKNILNVSGFSDRVFNVVGDFMEGKSGSGYWVQKIETTLI
jgi:60 kDa SS-A/Ro ribonucleoprotein